MPANRRYIFAAVLVVLVLASVAAVAYLYRTPSSTGGPHAKSFLIIASVTGFNDSADHGVPANSWPVIEVSRGSLVNITVYNEDKQTHSFQVAHYFDSSIQTIAPGQKLVVTFVADEAGTFSMKCVIPCSIHWAMQSGELVVT